VLGKLDSARMRCSMVVEYHPHCKHAAGGQQCRTHRGCGCGL
jgi:hypothetical protein